MSDKTVEEMIRELDRRKYGGTGWAWCKEETIRRAYADLPPEPQQETPQPNSTDRIQAEVTRIVPPPECVSETAIRQLRPLFTEVFALRSEVAQLRADLSAMIEDRNLWQAEHNEDCPNRATVAQLRAEVERKDKWISVDERLPILEDGRNRCQIHEVLLVFHHKYIYGGRCYVYNDGDIHWGVSHIVGDCKDYVTHWRPLPAPPSERDTQEGR